MSLEIKNLQESSLRDPRHFISMVNQRLMQIRNIETIFIDHCTLASKYFTDSKATFLVQIDDPRFYINEDSIMGDSKIGCALAFISSLSQTRDETNFIITTKNILDYMHVITSVLSPLYVFCNPVQSAGICVGQYGNLLLTLDMSRIIDYVKLIEHLNQLNFIALFEMDKPSVYLASTEQIDSGIRLNLVVRFNSANSPNQIKDILNLRIREACIGVDYKVHWELAHMPYYYPNQQHKAVVQKIAQKAAKKAISYKISESYNPIFQIGQFGPCMVIGCTKRKSRTTSLKEIDVISRIYSALIVSNGGSI